MIYATSDITAGVACGTGDGHCSRVASLLVVCDVRLAIDLIFYLLHTYFVIMSIDYVLWNVNLSDCRYLKVPVWTNINPSSVITYRYTPRSDIWNKLSADITSDLA